MAMIRLARILLVAMLLGPQVGMVVLPVEPLCQEERDCCDPEGVCDIECVQCACCTGRVPTLTSASSLERCSAASGAAPPAASAAPAQPAPRDILHVPKPV